MIRIVRFSQLLFLISFFLLAFLQANLTDQFIFEDLELEKLSKTNKAQSSIYYDNYYGLKEIYNFGLLQQFSFKDLKLKLHYENQKRLLYHFNTFSFRLQFIPDWYGWRIGSTLKNTPWQTLDSFSFDFALLIRYQKVFLFLEQFYYRDQLQKTFYFLKNNFFYQINEEITVGINLLYLVEMQWDWRFWVVYQNEKNIFKITYRDNPVSIALTFSWFFNRHLEIENSSLLNPILGIANRLVAGYWW